MERYQCLLNFLSLIVCNSKALKVKVTQLCLTLCDTMDDTAMEFSGPEYWSGWLFPSPGDLPNPGSEPRSPILQADYLTAVEWADYFPLKWVAYSFSSGSSQPSN